MQVLDDARHELRGSPRTAPGRAGDDSSSRPLERWLRVQLVNARRHIGGLRPLRRGDFRSPTGIGEPSEGQIRAVNELIDALRSTLDVRARRLGRAARGAFASPDPRRLERFLESKDRLLSSVQAIERIHDFYGELFGQRQSPVGVWLAGCDRIALDCYQDAFVGVGVVKSIPAPSPFSYMKTGFSPATFRRGIPLQRLGRRLNPFPLIELPMHRLASPWTLGAILHEVSHSLENELGLAEVVRERISGALRATGASEPVVAAITRWERELWADLSGTLLGGPAIVWSLFDVIGRSPAATLAFDPRAVHPPPELRAQVSVVLLDRMRFPRNARRAMALWRRLYPDPGRGSIPAELRRDFRARAEALVDALCYRPFAELGNRALAQVFAFGPKDEAMSVEAAQRLATGVDPGVVPERYLIGAARVALDRGLAPPGAIATNFYEALSRR